MAILNRFSAILLHSDSTYFLLLAAEFLAILGLRFCEYCDSRFDRFCAAKLQTLVAHIHFHRWVIRSSQTGTLQTGTLRIRAKSLERRH